MGKNNRRQRKHKQAIRKMMFGGMKDMMRRYNLDLQRRQKERGSKRG